jgi:hypothetical protein
MLILRDTAELQFSSEVGLELWLWLVSTRHGSTFTC